MIEPQFEKFSSRYDKGEAQVVWHTLVADLETPVAAMMKIAADKPNSFLLESIQNASIRERYSIIGMKPDLIWRCNGNKAEINTKALSDPEAFEPCDEGSLDSLRKLVRETRIDLPHQLPPMAAGLVGYMGYDMVRLMENLPDQNPDALGTPDGLFIRPTIMAIFDSVKDVVTLVTPVWPKNGTTAKAAYAQAEERISAVIEDFDKPLSRKDDFQNDVAPLPEPVSNMTQEEFDVMIEQAKEYIKSGDIFQVVLSQRFEVPFELPSFALYRALRRTNPSPFMYYLNFGDFAVTGSSPEILVRLRDGKVTIRPLAGTRKRGETPDEDQALINDLLADPKELAEHLMLLDLGRNDVGRVSKIGTVNVTEEFQIELYSHVMHIVSNVEGEISEDYDAINALVAGFPAGTVSGAPKVRAMEIIDELEKEKRGIYAGAVGYFSANGSMDTCIVLRTSIVKDGKMYIQAGAGVVYDSIAENEYQETVNKSMALIGAAREAVRFASEAGRGQ